MERGERGKSDTVCVCVCVWRGILSQQLVQIILSGSSVVGMLLAAGSRSPIILEEHTQSHNTLQASN